MGFFPLVFHKFVFSCWKRIQNWIQTIEETLRGLHLNVSLANMKSLSFFNHTLRDNKNKDNSRQPAQNKIMVGA